MSVYVELRLKKGLMFYLQLSPQVHGHTHKHRIKFCSTIVSKYIVYGVSKFAKALIFAPSTLYYFYLFKNIFLL